MQKLDLRIISHWLRVSYPLRSGRRENSVHFISYFQQNPQRCGIVTPQWNFFPLHAYYGILLKRGPHCCTQSWGNFKICHYPINAFHIRCKISYKWSWVTTVKKPKKLQTHFEWFALSYCRILPMCFEGHLQVPTKISLKHPHIINTYTTKSTFVWVNNPTSEILQSLITEGKHRIPVSHSDKMNHNENYQRNIDWLWNHSHVTEKGESQPSCLAF